MDFYTKGTPNPTAELMEFENYHKSKPQNTMSRGDYDQFLMGLFGTIGFYITKGKNNQQQLRFPPVWDEENKVYFFPQLDQYWSKLGRLYLEEDELRNYKLMTFKLKIAACLREADRRGELGNVIDLDRAVNIGNWLRLGGSE